MNVSQPELRSPCPLANGLDILGDRWTLLIVRDLMLTNRREFGHFLHADEGISTNILTNRLERLVNWDIISKRPHPEHGKKFIYELTDKGLGLAPTLLAFGRWAYEHIPGTQLPPPIAEQIQNDPDGVLDRIYNREVLWELPL